jgi:hypothetical protein
MLFWLVTHELWAVVNDALTPVDMPAEFVATSRKRYDVFGLRPVTTVETEAGEEPDPASAEAVEEPSDAVVPYEK